MPQDPPADALAVLEDLAGSVDGPSDLSADHGYYALSTHIVFEKMTTRRTGEAFEDTVQLTVVGARLAVGQAAPAFELDCLSPGDAFPHGVRLEDSAGAVRLLNVINSIDTPVCHVETRRWDEMLPEGVKTYTISMDLPFALSRWQTAENARHEFLSSHRAERFGVDYGVLLEEWRLLQRAVFVIAPDGTVAHAEYVADQMLEPDYDAALAAVRRLLPAPRTELR